MSFRRNLIRVAFSVTNQLCYDQRVLKMADTVSKLGCDIILIGRITEGCCAENNIPFSSKRFRMLFRKGFLFYAFYNIRLFFFLLFHSYDIIVSNDLDTLLPNYLISRIKGIPLVYDSHEYFTGVPELANRKFVRKVWQAIEKSLIPGLKHMITVSDSIASLYMDQYSVSPIVVRNVPGKLTGIIPYSREYMKVDKSDFLIIFQGMGINIDRGAEELLDALELTSGTSLIFVGSGDILKELKETVKRKKLEQKVKFFGPVDREVLARFTMAADAGVCLDKGTNLNYRFSLPNKLFDYISSGIPVLSGDLPETAKIIRENNCGVIVDPITPEKISAAIQLLKSNSDLFCQLKDNAIKASDSLNWETESSKVVELYKVILEEIKHGKK